MTESESRFAIRDPTTHLPRIETTTGKFGNQIWEILVGGGAERNVGIYELSHFGAHTDPDEHLRYPVVKLGPH